MLHLNRILLVGHCRLLENFPVYMDQKHLAFTCTGTESIIVFMNKIEKESSTTEDDPIKMLDSEDMSKNPFLASKPRVSLKLEISFI